MTVRDNQNVLQKELSQITNQIKMLQNQIDKLESELAPFVAKRPPSVDTKASRKNQISALRRYYNKHGISALRFKCKYERDCRSQCEDKKKFTTAREAYIGAQYGKKGIPRILFLSLDSGGGSNDPKEKTIETMRKGNLRIRSKGMPKVRHWYKTHQFAWIIFDEISRHFNLRWDIGQTNMKMFFEPESDIYKIMPFFAHTNSAKCCMNNPNSKVANKTLFANCREYIPDEIKIFNPHILVTQGTFARKAIDAGIKNGSFSKKSSKNISKASSANHDLMVIDINDGKPTMWIHHYHPNNYGTFAKNYKKYRAYAKEAAKFIGKNYPGLLNH